ncbi:MAG: hypothetical protein OEZ19_00850 [Paracoccaceae bacterium]|nr:hypothetical protein [Paracoccaceae bacterium]
MTDLTMLSARRECLAHEAGRLASFRQMEACGKVLAELTAVTHQALKKELARASDAQP